MKEGEASSALDTVISDISSLSDSFADNFELRLYSLSEYSKILCESCLSLIESGLLPSEALSSLPLEPFLTRMGSESEEKNLLCYNPEIIRRFGSLADRVCLTELLLSRLSLRDMPLTVSDFFPEEELDTTVTYVKGALADEAFELFSEELPQATVAYSESLREAAQAVKDGKVSFCILPLEERGGVRIPSVVRLIGEFGLKIISVTPVYGFMGDCDMKYALLSSSPKPIALLPEDDLYIELQLCKKDGISETLIAAESFSHEVYSVMSLPNADGGDSASVMIFKASPDRIVGFITYLTVFIREFSLIGIYKNLE